MSNPLRAPTANMYVDSMAFPDSFIELKNHPKLQEVEKRGKNLDVWKMKMQESGVDMDPFRTVVIPKSLTVIPEVHQKAGDVYATAQTMKLNLRIRSKHAHKVTDRVFRLLPEESLQYEFMSKKMIGARARETLSASGGTIYSMERVLKYYPKREEVVTTPPTAFEAAEAGIRCGLSMDRLEADQIRPYPLVYTEGEDNLRVNLKSDNGFPVGGNMSDPLAASKVHGLAKTIRQQAVGVAKLRGPRSLYNWVREQEESNPELWLLKGKTKGDYYKKDKIGNGMLRFYNAFPRQVVLNMQVATQVLERQSLNILDDPLKLHSGLGISLVRGGAEQLVDALDAQLASVGSAYVHVGDDSWVVVRAGGKLITFALDCSSFDLTQHGDATREIHASIRNELERVDAVAANLWHAVARERLVALVGGAVVRMKHAGPSGMPLQSKVNDMAMDIMIHRTLSKGTEEDFLEPGRLDALLQKVGGGMGFAVRLESYSAIDSATLKRALSVIPFLFVGYYFYTEDDKVRVVADLPRSFAQMPYPSQAWVKKDHELEVLEAMRLGSIYMSQGIYPSEGAKAQEAFKMTVESMLEEVIRKHGDVQDGSLLFAVSGDVYGPAPVASLKGLLAAIQRPLAELWDSESPMESESELLYGEWEDEVRREEKARGADRPADLTSNVKPVPVRHKPVPTHPATWNNWGRPPPTAVWGPDKPPKQRFRMEKITSTSRNARIGKVLPDEDSEGFMSDLDEEYEEYY